MGAGRNANHSFGIQRIKTKWALKCIRTMFFFCCCCCLFSGTLQFRPSPTAFFKVARVTKTHTHKHICVKKYLIFQESFPVNFYSDSELYILIIKQLHCFYIYITHVTAKLGNNIFIECKTSCCRSWCTNNVILSQCKDRLVCFQALRTQEDLHFEFLMASFPFRTILLYH